MRKCFCRFWVEEDGQDLIEYTLLMTFIVIACMWFVASGRSAVNGIWNTSNQSISAANSTAVGGD